MKNINVACALLGMVVSTGAMAGGPDDLSHTAAPTLAQIPAIVAKDQWYVGVRGGVQFMAGNTRLGDSWSDHFEPGWNIGGHVGYDFSAGFKAELAFDYMSHTNKKFKNHTADPWTLFANAMYSLDLGSSFYPYAGVGLGYIRGVGTFDGITEEHKKATGFACQAIAGVEYKLGSQLGITLDYRFVGRVVQVTHPPYFHQINVGVNYYFD